MPVVTFSVDNDNAVTASVPGYRSRTTNIWLEETASTVDFVLDPEVTPKVNLLVSACECNCGSSSGYGFMYFFHGIQFEVYILIAVLVFLCFLFQRRIRYNLSKHRQLGPRRPVAV